jgi:hypothetical protein
MYPKIDVKERTRIFDVPHQGEDINRKEIIKIYNAGYLPQQI